MKKKFKGTYVYLLLVVVLMLFVVYSTGRDVSQTTTPLSALNVITKIEQGEILSIEQIVSSSDDGKFIVIDTEGNRSVISAAQEAFSTYLYSLPAEQRASFTFISSEQQTSLFFPIMQIILIIGMFIFIMVFFVQQMQGGGGGMPKSNNWYRKRTNINDRFFRQHR